MLTKDRQDAVIALCKALVQQKSYSGEEGGVAAELRAFFDANGYDDVFVDDYGNTIGHIKGKRPGKKLLFDGHMDTVPVTDPLRGSTTPLPQKPWEARFTDAAPRT